jgi:hypothetical protein
MFEPCAETGLIAFQRLPRNVFQTLLGITAVISYAGLVFVTMTCNNYLVKQLSMVRLQREETSIVPFFPSPVC